MKRSGTTVRNSLGVVLAIALAAPAYAAEKPALQTSAQVKKVTVSSVSAAGVAALFTAKCESTLNMDVTFTSSWLASHVSAPQAQPENVNTVKLNLQGSSTVLPGYVECYYTSPGKDIYNLVYKFPCKNAKKQAVAANVYTCTK